MPTPSHALKETIDKGDTGKRLDHLTGARCIAALWINLAHFMPHELYTKKGVVRGDYFNGALYRVNVAVCFFVVMSGFVTQWAYGSRQMRGTAAHLKWYVQRVGKLFPAYFIAMVAGTIVLKIQGATFLTPRYMCMCFLMVQQWFTFCPNGPSWFVVAIAFCWIMYPLPRKIIRRMADYMGVNGLICLMMFWWMISMAPGTILFVHQNFYLNIAQHFAWSFSPPSQLADFGIGAAAAELALLLLRNERGAHPLEADSVSTSDSESGVCAPMRRARTAGIIADVCMMLILVAVLMVPQYPEAHAMNRIGWEPLFDHILTPCIAGFLCCSALSDGTGMTVRFMSHNGLVAFGAASFEVYIFQRPINDFWIMIFDRNSPEAFFGFLIVLWAFSVSFAAHLQPIFDNWLRVLVDIIFSRWDSPEIPRI